MADESRALVPAGPVQNRGAVRDGGIRLEPWQVEVFARGLIAHGNLRRAKASAKVVDYRYPADVLAARVAALPEVVAKVQELRALGTAIVDEGGVSRETAEAEVMAVYEEAREVGELSVALKALGTLGGWRGWNTTKVEVTHRRGVTELTDDELEALAANALKDRSIEGEVG